ncbi:MAG: PrsW family glutamic-type intramembrane protease [Hyphomicrobiales bacterium]
MPRAGSWSRRARSSASKESSIRRRSTITGIAAVAGALAFLTGLTLLLAIPAVDDDDPAERLFELNLVLSSAIVYAALGGFLVVQAASALGGASSSPMRFGWQWFLLPVFPVMVAAGQALASNPEHLPWVFPFVNVAMVSVPSLVIAALVAARYHRAHPLAWPMSWREWTTGFIYGAIGATTIAAIINTGYLGAMGTFLVHRYGEGSGSDLQDSIQSLPKGWGIFLDVTTLSVVAPLNEEFWKGSLVALFFFRRGGPARCFAWGVLAGTGFNLLETFTNSLAAVSPETLANQQIGNAWWLFACARGGTAVMHGLASGLSALGIYGLLRHQPRYLLGYVGGVLLHGTWNFLVYVIYGDAFLSLQGPNSEALDILGSAGLVLVFAAALAMLWLLPAELRDPAPAPIYRMLGMVPARAEVPVPQADRTSAGV